MGLGGGRTEPELPVPGEVGQDLRTLGDGEEIPAPGQGWVLQFSMSHILSARAPGPLLDSGVGVPSGLSRWMPEAEQACHPKQPSSHPCSIHLAVCLLGGASPDGTLLAGGTCGPA